jgi:hypothetical protein
MKLFDVLNHNNTREKTSFYNVLNNLIENVDAEEIDEILDNNSRQVKEIDNENIAKVFTLLKNEYLQHIKNTLAENLSQLDILIDILIKDGNSILEDRWFEEIYKNELSSLVKASKQFINLIDGESRELDDTRRRDYNIYRSCVITSYTNDEANNLDKKVTADEFSILQTLAEELELSNEEVRLINFSVVPLEPLDIDTIIKQLKDIGIVFFHKKDYRLYIPDEIVKICREIRGKNVADKYLRRVLRTLQGSKLNAICKLHNINQRIGEDEKIKQIIKHGISFKTILSQSIYKPGLLMNDKKKELNQIMVNLGIPAKGTTLDDKIQRIINHFLKLEADETVGISTDGYTVLCQDLNEILPPVNEFLKNEFQFQEDNVLDSDHLMAHNIKPRDILDLLTKEQIKTLCKAKEISNRGDDIQNILDAYTDTESIYIENFIHIGNRDLNTLKANNINISAAEIGIKYEHVTKLLFKELGFDVNDELRAQINSKKDKIDILLKTGENEVIIVECKTAKSTKYNKFSACSRQIKSYQRHAETNGYRVIKTLLVAPDFTSEFIEDCDLDIELNLSLITSEVLYNICNGFKRAKQQVFPMNLLMRDAMISDTKILKALKVK